MLTSVYWTPRSDAHFSHLPVHTACPSWSLLLGPISAVYRKDNYALIKSGDVRLVHSTCEVRWIYLRAPTQTKESDAPPMKLGRPKNTFFVCRTHCTSMTELNIYIYSYIYCILCLVTFMSFLFCYSDSCAGANNVSLRNNINIMFLDIIPVLYVELYFPVKHNNIPINSLTFHCA
jgi:hypothetical protein